ncbi:MAG: peptidoglycan-binding domain-containing protein, partial [Pseudomonadota bacterium]|nr:peptidoglycan-binding domain-containing protein [Pseudomonadota bacterium]
GPTATAAAAGPTAGQAAGPAAAAAPKGPAWAQKPHVAGTLKEGAEGPDVAALQGALGIAVTSKFDAVTKAALQKWQKANGLGDDGIAGKGTLGKLGLRDAFRSPDHTDTAFIPTYRATAYSESDMYRTKADPYAVGAITNPDKADDDGGKTYGTYQFESYIYKDGSKKSDDAVAGSTVMRFANWKDNPYGARLQAVIKTDGVTSPAFDTLWGELTAKENAAFGKAQERFLEHDKADEVTAFFDAAGVSAEARKDLDLYDVVIGTVNQYGSLAKGMAAAVKAKQDAKKSPLTADEVGAALQDDKSAKVSTHFKSSPKAHAGIKERIGREKGLFES